MSEAETAEALPFVVDIVRTTVADGRTTEFATYASVIASLELCGIGVLATAEALWGEERGELAQLLARCPITHLRKLGNTSLLAQGMGAVAAAQLEPGA